MAIFAFLLLTALPAAPIPATGQKLAPETHEPVVVSAAALKYGAELKEHASPQLQKWAKKQLNKELASDPEQLRRLNETVEGGFPAVSPEMREAIQFLIFYFGYEAEEEIHHGHTSSLQEIDREIRELHDRQRMRGRDEGWISQRLDSARMRRAIASKSEALSRERADAYLRLLNDRQKNLTSLPAESIQQIQAVPQNTR